MVDGADDREQGSRRKTLLHRPETIRVPFACDHQEAFRRQAERFQARSVEMAELGAVQPALAPEHHLLLVRRSVHEGGDQGERKIPHRGLIEIAARDQLVQGGPCFGFANERWFIPGSAVRRETIGILDVMTFDPADPPFERSETVGSIPFNGQMVFGARVDHRWFGCFVPKRKRLVSLVCSYFVLIVKII